MTPQRIQRRRTKGWRMPEGAVYVGRPTVYGNPFRAVHRDGRWSVEDDNGVGYDPIGDHRHGAMQTAVSLYADELTRWLGGRMEYDREFRGAVLALAGRDLACWCPLDQPCHADVLLDLANRDPS